MTTILDTPEVDVIDLDLVGYVDMGGKGRFVLLNPVVSAHRQLPKGEAFPVPKCIPAAVQNNQAINLSGRMATLHDINGVWYIKFGNADELEVLKSHVFFEVGHLR